MTSERVDPAECSRLLKKSVAFNQLTDEQLLTLAKAAEKVTYTEQQVVHSEKQRQTALYTVVSGRIQRERHDENGKVHLIDTSVCGSTVGALHAMNQDPAFATARCIDVRRCLTNGSTW
jgi:CRP-like cAMP-binding protein